MVCVCVSGGCGSFYSMCCELYTLCMYSTVCIKGILYYLTYSCMRRRLQLVVCVPLLSASHFATSSLVDLQSEGRTHFTTVISAW